MSLTPLSEAALIAEYEIIVESLKKNKFNKRKAAQELKIDPKTLYNRLNEYYRMIDQKQVKNESISGTY